MAHPGPPDEALAAARKAAELAPGNAKLLYQLGCLLGDRGKTGDAIAAYRKALAADPAHVSAHNNLGVALLKAGKPREAIASFRRTIELQPGHARAHRNLGTALLELKRIDEAIASWTKSLELDPGSAETLYYLALGCWMTLRLDDSIAHYERAISIAPDKALYHWNYSLALLMAGNYVDGWREYQWRWEGCADQKGMKPALSRPEWRGEDISGKTILLFRDQGYGDVIQFIRYASLLAARGAKVVLACQQPLASLLSTVEGVSAAAPDSSALPRFDAWSSLMALPHVFGTTLQTIPAREPYIKADPELSAAWRKRMQPSSAFKVGLIWAGKPTHRDDARRSIALAEFLPLAQVPGVEFYSLQKGEAAAQAQSPPTGLTLIDWTADIRDFADTAALMDNLDLIISADTAGAHLAGAMGKPVWLLNRYESEWRWMLGRSDSPWYPTMRIFRQPKPGGWAPVINDVAGALLARVHEHGGTGLAPDDAPARVALGNKFRRLGKHKEAAVHFRAAIAIDPRIPAAHSDLGISLLALGKTREAIACFRQAIEVDPAYSHAYNNLGTALISLKDLEQAAGHFRKAIELAPRTASAHLNLGNCYFLMRLLREASEAYEAAFALADAEPKHHWHYALALLMTGRYEKGWREYEWRWAGSPELQDQRPKFEQPEWQGEDIRGKTILLYAEQGMGDAIQFARYAPLVAARGAKVIVWCHHPVARLLRGMPAIHAVVPGKKPLPPFDVHLAMLSLPRVFETTLDTIPARVPYLQPPQDLVDAWRTRVGRQPGLRVGLAWGGNEKNRHDKTRSCPLSAFAPLAKTGAVTFFSLQKGGYAEQAKSPPPGMTLVDLMDEARDFADTAALMASLDLVISVDTAIAHLAGALGKPVWLLNRHESEWRWMLDREDSPWYPTMRIFRQPRPGDWDGVLDEVAKALAGLARKPGKTPASPHAARGDQLARERKHAEAVAHYRKAVEQDPGNAIAHNNLGTALFELNRLDEAVASWTKALELNPDSAAANHTFAINCRSAQRLDQAIAHFERALALASRPDYSEATDVARIHWNYAGALLAAGRYEEGWREYEWRWTGGPQFKGLKPAFSRPEWSGEDIAGKTLLVHAEQGFGDVIQFSRYAALAAARGAKVVLACQPQLVRLLATLPGAGAVVSYARKPLPEFDFHCMLLTLPHLLGTTLATVPAKVPYIQADPELAAAWGKRMKPSPALKVGLIWAGTAKHSNDARRSIELKDLGALAAVPGVQFYSLQMGEPAAQAKSPPRGMDLVDWTADIKDFADTAALMANLDLVISVDTAGIHLAGALGKPAWLLNRYESDWRWMVGREDSPWYPTLRIFRQPVRGNWSDVLSAVGKELRLASFQRAAKLGPGLASAHNNVGSALCELMRHAEALPCFRRALELRPDHGATLNNLASALVALRRYDEAIPVCLGAIKLDPGMHLMHYNLANCHAGLLRPDKAIPSFERAIELSPQAPKYRWNYCLALLMQGDYARGWKEYEMRWDVVPRAAKHKPSYAKPRWHGEDVRGKTILLHCEQGFGDSLQFIRYAPLLARRGARVVVNAPPALAGLLSRVEGVQEVVSGKNARVQFDLYCPLLSLPHVFKTTLATIPWHGPYISADEGLAAEWSRRIGSSGEFKVGLIWAGGEKTSSDPLRSIPLSAFAPLASIPGVRFYSLQKGEKAVEASSPPPGLQLIDWTADLRDFADTAALVQNLDLVISADTAGAHLAGAMGKPVWLLNRHESEWRWMLNRADSPWYPTLRIFRQPKPGDWPSVLSDVAKALGKQLGKQPAKADGAKPAKSRQARRAKKKKKK